MSVITLNDLTVGLTEAIIREWYVKESDSLSKGERLLAFETAKAIMEAPIPCDGTIKRILTSVGERVSAEQPLIELVD